MTFTEALKTQTLIVDGAMGTMIQELPLTPADFGGESFEMLADLLNFSRPMDLMEIHLQYLGAGANIIETNTFGSCPLRLSEFDFTEINTSQFTALPPETDLTSMEALTYHLNVAGCTVANQARREYQNSAAYDGRPLFIAGSVGPSNYVLSSTTADLKQGTWELVEDNFYHQACGLLDGGADIILFETQQDILELKAAVSGAKKAMADKSRALPVMAQITVDQFAKMQIFHTDIHAAITTLQGIGIDTFGINCSIGPDLMNSAVETLSRYSRLPISVLPNAGMPVSENGNTVYTLSPESLADHLHRFVTEHGVSIVGGCCGTTPEHIRAISDRLKGVVPPIRQPDTSVWISGPQNAVPVDSSGSLIRIGERLNVRGSKKVRIAVETEGSAMDYDVLEEVIDEQLNTLGTIVIDVCMDSNVVDTKKILPDVIRKMTTDFKGAMCLDSFDGEAIAEAVKAYPGRPVINSISMEEVSPGVSKAESLVAATCFHNPLYIALAADDNGPATTAGKKAEIAAAIVDTCRKYDVCPEQILVDINAFPIGSEPVEGLNFALESLKAIPLIKKNHKGIKTTIGVSNLTNGLASKPYMRRVLTSVFLDEGRKKGLDAAIVNPNHYAPVETINGHDYELGLRVILQRDMDAFAELEAIAVQKTGRKPPEKNAYGKLPPEEAVREKIIDGVKERCTGTINTGGITYEYTDRIVETAAKAIGKIPPLNFINAYLMDAMKTLGDRFSSGDASLPHLLKAADLMKQVMGFIEYYMAKTSGSEIPATKGTIVIGTVYQDVHSIGKDLSKTLLENYGYRVIDLGVQVPLERFIETAVNEKADAIGMSALLVQTSGHMVTVSSMMKERGIDLPLLIGGAPVNMKHAAAVAMGGESEPCSIKPDVFYCSSAMDAVNVMEALNSDTKETFVNHNKEALLKRLIRKTRTDTNQTGSPANPAAGPVDFTGHVLKVSDPGLETISLPLSKLKLNTEVLYGLNWNMGPKSSWEKNGLSPDRLETLKKEWITKSESNRWVTPSGIIGLFPCRSAGNSVTLYDPEDWSNEVGTLTFSEFKRNGGEGLFTPASWFRSTEDDTVDFIGLQISTGGAHSGSAVKHFTDTHDLESAFMLQGLANRAAEDLAEHLHAKLREKTGVLKTTGARFSPGYPGLSDIQNNITVFNLLNAESLGISITEAGGFYPTATTAAAVCFHPEAGY